MAVANFVQQGNYLLRATYKDGKHVDYYTNLPTEGMHRLLSNYKKVFNLAYGIAKEQVWPFVWLVGGEIYRINCALLQKNAAQENLPPNYGEDKMNSIVSNIHTLQSWPGGHLW